MQHNFLTRLLLTLTLMLGISTNVWADENNEAARYAGFEALPAAKDGDVVFIGNSITHMMNWWEALGNKHNIHGRGNSGAKTYQALANLESMIAGQPSKAFVMLGTNDFGNGDSVEHVVHLVKTLLKRIRLESPRTTVYCQGILPSGYGNPRLTRITPANELIKAWIEEQDDEKLVYVDINSLFNDGAGHIKNRSNDRTTSWSYDDLHLTPLGYRVWMNELEQYLDDTECVIPDNANLKNLHGDQQTSWGARIATFGTMPVTGDDILMFGDDFIHYGEWHEMTGSTDFKDRGNGWQFFSTTLETVKAAIVPALSKTQDNVTNCGVARVNPRAICINAGGRNIMNGQTDEQVQASFRAVVDEACNQTSASTPIFLMSLMPVDNATKNAQFKTLNSYMQTLASEMTNVYYVDLYSAMSSGDTQIAKYFHANKNWSLNGTTLHPYPTPLGYVKVANVLCEKLNDVLHTDYRPISEEQAQANITRFANRTIVGNAVNDVYNKLYNVGDAPGQYSASNIEQAETLIAKACKVLWNTDVTADEANAAIAPLQAMTFTVNLPNVSDATHQYLYTISDKRGNKFITANSANNTLAANSTASGAADQQWRLTQNVDGTFNIQNVLTGGYLNMTQSTITTSADVPAKGWTLTGADGYFTITSDANQINNANSTGTTVHNWGGGNNNTDTGCLFRFVLAEEIVPPVILEPELPYGEGSGLNNLMPKPVSVTKTSGAYNGNSITENIVSDDELGLFNHQVADFANEGYKLSVTSSGITITAASPVGVIRAKQTLAQMRLEDGSYECCEIEDYPAFKYRGYMHDLGRSFIPFEDVKKELELLARFKVNVFHWHLTDNQGFRFETKESDLKALNTSGSRWGTSYYTQDQCRQLNDLAKSLGMYIIPEIDMPGHSETWVRALGYSMTDSRGIDASKRILREVAACFPDAPYIHIGADESGATESYVKGITDFVHNDLHRKAVCWNRFGNNQLVNPTTMGVDMLTNWASRGTRVDGVPNVDMRYFYVNHFDVFADLAGAYRSLVFNEQKGTNSVGGVSIGIWNDRLLTDQNQIYAQNNTYAAIIAMTERAWRGGGKQYIENGGAYLPNEGEEYDEFADWERRFILYKNSWLNEVAHNIPYVKQTNIRWNITPAYDNGGNGATKFDIEDAKELTVQPGSTFATGAGVWLNHIWANTIAGVLGKAAQSKGVTRYAWTYVYSPTAQTVGAQIEFYNYSRSDGGSLPANGKWDRYGSQVWLNDAELTPTWDWTAAGSGLENNLGNLNFPGRSPLQVQLKQGWNKVLIKLPYTQAGDPGRGKWQYTFVFTTPDGRNAVDGLVYSPTKSTDGTENFDVPELPRVAPTPYTEADPHVYRIKSRRGGYYIKDNGKGAALTTNASATTDSDKFLWKFVERSTGVYDIVSYSTGGYLSPVPVTSNQLGCVETKPSEGWTLGNGSTETYFIVTSGTAQLHNDKANKVLNWGYSNNQFNTTDEGCEFIFEEVEEFGQPDAPAGQRYTIRLVDTDFYFTTNEVADNTNKTYSISTEPEVFIVTKVDGGYTIVSENGKQVGVNSNGWDFANSAYTWNIENIEEPTRILMNGQQKGIGIDSKTNNAAAFSDKHSGNAKNGYGATCYTWLFEAVDDPAAEVYYTITNHQKNNDVTYALYVDGGQLKIGESKKAATEYGDAALFVKEPKDGGKYAFRNKASGEYLVFCGRGSGTNSDKGVLSTYDATYCDFTVTACTTNVTDGVLLTGKRNNSSNGTLVLKNDGTFDAWSDPTECWNDNYSNVFTLEEVRVEVATIDYIIDKDHGDLYNTSGSPNQNWNATWKSTQQPELQLIAYDNRKAVTNNMTWSSTTLRIESGQLPPCTYTLSAPEGYVIDSYAFDFKANTTTTNTLTVGGTQYTTSQTVQHAAVTNVNAQKASFVLAGTNDKGTLLTNFVVRLRKLGAEEPEPDVLFTTEAEAADDAYRWVRVTNVRDAYSIHAGTEAALHSQATDFTNEGELFALVGTAESFKLYSRTAQAYFGYSATGGGSAVTKGAATQTFKLVDNTSNSQPGFNIVPTGNEGQSFNMHGGKGNDIKFYSTGDAGSTWKIALVNSEVQGGIRLNGTASTSDTNKLIGKLSVTVGTTSSETLATTDDVNGNITYYVNAKDRLSITAGTTFRGYKAPTVDGMNVTYTVDADNKAQYLFYSTGAAHPYRIPSITRTRSGRLIAFSDYRFGGGDIGNGRVDIVARTSDDNGRTWSPERTILQGDGNGQSRTCGFGDAASVADCESDDVMLMCCSAPNGGTCWTAAQRGVVAISHNGGQTWETPVDIKDQICNATGSLLEGTNIVNYFVGSGKLHQSRYIKVGSHYRVYAPLFTTPGSGYNNYVVYTDDFGKTWKLLGTTTTCVSGGNEPKCEELPDGSVIISSRKGSGRYYNVFTYDKNDKTYTTGSWGIAVTGCNSGDSGTDGEILITKATKADGQLVTIALQSMPNSGRNNVTIWYKELNGEIGHNFTSSEFSGAWTKGLEVSATSSAYSTMCMQNDGRIAFFFEEGPANYEMVYMPLSISEATGGAYGPDVWTVGHEAKAVKMANDGTCTVREIDEIGRYIIHPAK